METRVIRTTANSNHSNTNGIQDTKTTIVSLPLAYKLSLSKVRYNLVSVLLAISETYHILSNRF